MLLKSCQTVVKKLSKSCQKVVKKLYKIVCKTSLTFLDCDSFHFLLLFPKQHEFNLVLGSLPSSAQNFPLE
jgi:hypothetical protein